MAWFRLGAKPLLELKMAILANGNKRRRASVVATREMYLKTLTVK